MKTAINFNELRESMEFPIRFIIATAQTLLTQRDKTACLVVEKKADDEYAIYEYKNERWEYTHRVAALVNEAMGLSGFDFSKTHTFVNGSLMRKEKALQIAQNKPQEAELFEADVIVQPEKKRAKNAKKEPKNPM